jgi:hypothetical protein
VGGGKILSFFSPLPQNILVPPTPSTGRRFPLLCEKKNDNFVLFFLTRARDAATPRAVGSALTGNRLRAETEAAPVQRSSARGGKRCVTPSTSARFAPQGAECLLPPLSSAWLCAGAGKVSDDDPVYCLAPVVAPGSTRARTRVHTTRTEPGCTHMIGVLCRGRCSPPGCAMGWA